MHTYVREERWVRVSFASGAVFRDHLLDPVDGDIAEYRCLVARIKRRVGSENPCWAAIL